MFQPYVARILPPRSSAAFAVSDEEIQTREPVRNIRVPVSTTIDLSLIPAEGVLDYFLWHPFQGSVDGVFVGAFSSITLPGNPSFQIVQKRGSIVTELSSARTVREFGIEPEDLGRVTGKTEANDPVFLRVRMASTAQSLFVTLHAIIPEVT